MTPKHILLIDNDTIFLARMQKILQQENYQVSLTRSAREAEIALERQTPHLIILALKLPDTDGYTLLEKIKENPEWRFIPVLVMTNSSEFEADRLTGLRLGVMDYMTKPLDELEICAHVRNILDFFSVRNAKPEISSTSSQEKLLKYMTENGIRNLMPGVRREAKVGYEYPEAAKILNPEELGGEIYILESMAKAGFLERIFFDAIHQCPDCGHHDLNFRELCPQCHHADIDALKMVTCQSCNHRDLESKFRTITHFRCPQCLEVIETTELDYERSASALRECQDCGAQFTESILNCRCMNCNNLFDHSVALTRKVYTYKLVSEKFEPKKPKPPTISIAFANDDIEKLLKEQRLKKLRENEFEEAVEEAIEEATESDKSVALLLIRLKLVEEAEADPEKMQLAYKRFINAIQQVIRPRDCLHVNTWDDWVILLPTTSYRMAKVIANRLAHSLKALEYEFIASFNLVGYPEDGLHAAELLHVLRLGVVSSLHPDGY